MGCCGNDMMRKCSTLHCKQISTGDSDCPEEVKLTKQIKCWIGSKAASGDAEEEFNLKEVDFGDSSANPNPDASSASPEVVEAASTQ